MFKVAKFGGSSVASAAQFAKVKAIMQADPARRVAVVSAAGKRSSDDHKLTDLLYLVHAHLRYGVPAGEILTDIRSRFVEIRDALGLSYAVEEEFDAYAERLSKDTNVDELVSRGEYFTSKLMADYLGFSFVDAADCIFFGYDGKLDEAKTYAAIDEAISAHGHVVIPGFYGSLPGGHIKVMSRGGSDITGALAAAAIGAEVYENWTDVSGILMADPRIVSDPKPTSYLTYDELQELATMGASVLHEESVRPVRNKGIPLNIRNTNRPEDAGTMIVGKVGEEEAGDRFITGLAGKKNYTILNVKKQDNNNSYPLRHSLKILDRYNVTAEHVTLGLDSFAIVVPTDELEGSFFDVLNAIKTESGADEIQTQDRIAMVAVVSRKMASRPGISGKIFGALGDAGVNIRTIKQGADELSIIIGVGNDDFEKTIRILYDAFAG